MTKPKEYDWERLEGKRIESWSKDGVTVYVPKCIRCSKDPKTCGVESSNRILENELKSGDPKSGKIVYCFDFIKK